MAGPKFFMPDMATVEQQAKTLQAEADSKNRGNGPEFFRVAPGKNVLRILPGWDAQHWHQKCYFYFGKNVNITGRFTDYERTFPGFQLDGKPYKCPITEVLDEAERRGTEVDWRVKASCKVYFNAVAYTMLDDAGNKLPPTQVILEHSEGLLTWLITTIYDLQVTQGISLVDPYEGVNIMIENDPNGGPQRYKYSIMQDPVKFVPFQSMVVPDDKEATDKILDNISDLSRIYRFPDPSTAEKEETKAKLIEKRQATLTKLAGAAGAYANFFNILDFKPTLDVTAGLPFTPPAATGVPAQPAAQAPAATASAQTSAPAQAAPEALRQEEAPQSPAQHSTPAPASQDPPMNNGSTLPACYRKHGTDEVNPDQCLICPHEITCEEEAGQ